jgi:DNA polymerase-3 subunit delta'
MQFLNIIGHQETKKQLIHMVQHNRLSHALLFLGKEGNGALQLARAMAQYIVCDKVNGKKNNSVIPIIEAPSLFGEPEPVAAVAPDSATETLTDSCGVCPSCQKATQLIHPDIHFSYPVFTRKSGDKPLSTEFMTEWREFVNKQPYGNNYDWLQFIEAENKQGNISAHECNDITRKMSLKSFEAEYKILIMWMPEMLGKEGNKLLKLIEEPPPNTLFLFVAENEALILPTILSRTQLIKIPQLTKQDIEQALQQRENLPASKAAQIAAISDGSYREALQQIAHSDDDWEVLLRDWLNSILKTGPVVQVKWIEEVSKIGREKQKQFLLYFIHLLQTALHVRLVQPSGDEDPATFSHELADFAARFNRICGVEQQEAIVHELDQAIYYIERNANPKMLFHALTIKLYHIISNKSIILM